MKKRVYIAGPISKGDLCHNIRQADEAFAVLVKAGFAPLCPHWSAFAGSVFRSGDSVCGSASAMSELPLTHADWLGVDLPWVAASDAVLRLPGESTGADVEVAHAEHCGVPVFGSVNDLVAYFGPLTEVP
jgi:hypothetical protein